MKTCRQWVREGIENLNALETECENMRWRDETMMERRECDGEEWGESNAMCLRKLSCSKRCWQPARHVKNTAGTTETCDSLVRLPRYRISAIHCQFVNIACIYSDKFTYLALVCQEIPVINTKFFCCLVARHLLEPTMRT